MMFISWTEQHDSVIYPDEPGNITAIAGIIGVSVKEVQDAIKNKNT